jgi:hypothetical protein
MGRGVWLLLVSFFVGELARADACLAITNRVFRQPPHEAADSFSSVSSPEQFYRIAKALGERFSPAYQLPGHSHDEYILAFGSSYRIFHRLGAGMMGEAFLAIEGSRVVVVKRLSQSTREAIESQDELGQHLLRSWNTEVLATKFLDERGVAVAKIMHADLKRGLIVKPYAFGPTGREVVPESANAVSMKAFMSEIKKLCQNSDFQNLAAAHNTHGAVDVTQPGNLVLTLNGWVLVDP